MSGMETDKKFYIRFSPQNHADISSIFFLPILVYEAYCHLISPAMPFIG